MRRLALVLLLIVAARATVIPARAQASQPRLIVLLVVDQMRADYIDRFRANWTGGLARLVREGAWFRNAEYPFANTVTCAGHASISTGTLPSTHGMIMNTWWDRDFGRVVACADDPTTVALSYGKALSASGSSAARLLVPTLADELRTQRSMSTKVAAFSLKARSAVTLGGQRPDAIAWVADEGAWVTSTAYTPNGLNPDIARFVNAHPVEHQLWTMWDRLLPKHAYVNAGHTVGPEGESLERFPHPIRTWDEWETSPLSDEYLARMAFDTARNERFGADDQPDFLAISFSALDLVGHIYGPDSQEVEDVLLRLDRTLGQLLDGLDLLVGRDNYVVALTADHGVAPIPENGNAHGVEAGRIPARAIPDAAQAAITSVLGRGRWVNRLMNGDLYLAPGVLEQLHEKPGAIDDVAAAIRKVAGVENVFSRENILNASPYDDRIRPLANSFVPFRSGDFVVVFKPYWLVGTTNNANHGTFYTYDTRVPIVLAGAGIKSGEYLSRVTPLDIAPTLAQLVGIAMPRAQGLVLRQAFSGRH